MESTTNITPEMMAENISRNINSDFFVALLNRSWEKNKSITYLGEMIGEAYNFHILFKDGQGFEEYMQVMEKMYDEHHMLLADPNISQEEKMNLSYEFSRRKARYLATVIAKRLNINVYTATSDDVLRVKEYFLHEYVENGYVSHSFPDAYRSAIMQNGLVANPGVRRDGANEKMKIQKMFMNHGVVAPLGGYPYYGGSGIYYEHDFKNILYHSIGSPEWFKWFTSSDHINTYHEGVEKTPYVLRNEPMCRRNVRDLCFNAGLSDMETMRVMAFYSDNYRRFESSRFNVALIPKKIVGKDDVSQLGVEDMGIVDTIISVMRDSKGQYVEHSGNVSRKDIPASEFVVTEVPAAHRYITAPEEYHRESKDELLDSDKGLAMVEHIKAQEGMVEELRAPLEHTKGILEARKKSNLPQSSEEEKFDQRSDDEVAIAGAIRRENQTIAAKKKQAKEMNKGHVYTLKKKDDNNEGFVSSMILSAVIGMAIAMMITVLFLVIM